MSSARPTRAEGAGRGRFLRQVLPILLAMSLALCCATKQTEAPADGHDARADKSKKKTVILSTVFDDQKAGAEAAKAIEMEMGIYPSPTLTAYVEKIGRRLVGYAPLQPFHYRFAIVDQFTPNAFSLPGGYIYVSRGLIALAATEDELANVLGHEIVHAAERHIAAQQELARRTNPFLMPYVRIGKLAAHSRDHERAADRGGQQIAARAGYDPAALASFLAQLGSAERLTLGYSRLPSYFDTHPGTTERIATTSARAVTIDWKPDANRRTGNEAYLEQIEGVVLDTDPREGIFRENEFIHADMDFRILFPRDWHLVNTHQAVGAYSRNGKARILLTAGPARMPVDETIPYEDWGSVPASERRPISPAEAAELYADHHDPEFRFRVIKSQGVKIGALDAHRIELGGQFGRTGVGGQVTFIAHKGVMFRLTSLASASSWSQYSARALTTARTFRPLEADERDSVEVIHLRVVHALAGEGIAALSQRTGNVWTLAQTAVLNGVFVDRRFEEGQLVKIARASKYEPAQSAGKDTPTPPP